MNIVILFVSLLAGWAAAATGLQPPRPVPADVLETVDGARNRSMDWALAGLSSVSVLSLGWGASLRRKMKHRTRALETEIGERERAEKFLNSILANLPISVFLKDAKELRFLMWNKFNEDLCGYESAEMIGKCDHDLFSKEQADAFVAKDQEMGWSLTAHSPGPGRGAAFTLELPLQPGGQACPPATPDRLKEQNS